MVDPFFEAAAYQNAYGAADQAAINAGQEPVYGTTGSRPGQAYYDRDQLVKDPKYRKAYDDANQGLFYDDAVGEASRYKVPLRDWLDKSPSDRQQYRDDAWYKNPFNISGDKWNWAPWNQPRNPQTEDHDFPPGESQTVPFDFPAGQGSFQFGVTVSAKVDVYGTPFPQTSASYQNSYPIGAQRYFVGVPEYIRVESLPNTGFSVWVKLRGRNEENVTGIALGPVQPQGAYSIASAPQVSIESIPGQANIPWPRTKDVPIPETQQLPQASPLDPPQYAPAGYPEIDAPPSPYASPQRKPNFRPNPAPNFSPSPYRNPTTQPSPTPQPQIDPTAPPTTQPNPSPTPRPFFDPFFNPFFNPYANPSPTGYRNTSTTSRSPNATPDNLAVPDILDELSYETISDSGLPPPEVDMCKDPCIKDIHDSAKGQKPKSITYKVFKKCGKNGPEFQDKTISISGDVADSIKVLLDDIADRKAEKCTPTDCYAAIPDSHEIRIVGTPPQLVVQYAEQLPDGKFGAPKYSISIPYYRYSEADTTASRFPKYTKGQRFGVLVLEDNSKLIVNAVSETEVDRVLAALRLLIMPSKLERVIISNNARRGQALKQIKVVPRIAKYFTGGRGTDGKPQWIKYF